MTDSLGFIHHFIPGGGTPAAPVLLLLHGTGGDENQLVELGSSLHPGASLLSPRGKTLERGNARFFERFADGTFDEKDLIRRTHELADFVEAAAREYSFPAGNVVAVGYSNGANVAASIFLLRPRILRGAVLFRAMIPLTPEKSPDLTAIPIFLAGGKADVLISPENTEQLAVVLRSLGADVTQHWSPGGHELSAPEIAAAESWLTTHFA